jgi:hypothetical protein
VNCKTIDRERSKRWAVLCAALRTSSGPGVCSSLSATPDGPSSSRPWHPHRRCHSRLHDVIKRDEMTNLHPCNLHEIWEQILR